MTRHESLPVHKMESSKNKKKEKVICLNLVSLDFFFFVFSVFCFCRVGIFGGISSRICSASFYLFFFSLFVRSSVLISFKQSSDEK